MEWTGCHDGRKSIEGELTLEDGVKQEKKCFSITHKTQSHLCRTLTANTGIVNYHITGERLFWNLPQSVRPLMQEKSYSMLPSFCITTLSICFVCPSIASIST